MEATQTEEIIEVNRTPETENFDRIMGDLQDIVLSEEFICIRDLFISEHCNNFDDAEENKLEYTAIFEKYSDMVEGYVESELRERNQDFDMTDFLKDLEEQTKKESLQSDVIDLLMTFSDFPSFKSAMLEAKKVCAGRPSSFDDCLKVSGI